MSLPSLFEGERALVPSTLRGYRTWRAGYVYGIPSLVSSAYECAWDLPEASAQCMRYELILQPQVHATPVRDCTCGFYGWYDPQDTRIVSGPLFGAVDASGSVVLGTHGFRAEKARVRAVSLDALLPVDLDRFREVLTAAGVEVFRSRSELVRAYPPEDVTGLVEHSCDPGCMATPAAAARVQSLMTSMAAQLGPTATLSSWHTAVPSPAVYLNPPPRPSRRRRWLRRAALIASAAMLSWCVTSFVFDVATGRWAWAGVNAVCVGYWTWRWRVTRGWPR